MVAKVIVGVFFATAPLAASLGVVAWAILGLAVVVLLVACATAIKSLAVSRQIVQSSKELVAEISNLVAETSKISEQVSRFHLELDARAGLEAGTAIVQENSTKNLVALLGSSELASQRLQYASQIVLSTVGTPLIKVAAAKAGTVTALRRLRRGERD